jgi:hypothetical protein
MHGAQPAAILNARRRHGLPHFCGVETHVIARHRLNPGHRPTTIMRESSPMARMLRCTDGFIEPLTGTAEAGTRRPKLTSRSTPLPSRVGVVCQVPLPRARASCVWRLATSFQFNQREKEINSCYIGKLPEQNGPGPVWALRAAFPTTANSSERAGAVARCRSLSTIRRQL